jgi:bisphosphoglycerate-independent phosphoglycerate mutase (AlkP superfamily)
MNSYKQFISERHQWYNPKKYTTIKEIEDRYYSTGDKANDTFRTKNGEYYTVLAKTKEVDKYKEYNWSSSKFRQQNYNPGYWDELKEDIKKNGILDPLIIILYEFEPKKAHLGEGNHRLAIAKELGIKELPVRILFYKGRRNSSYEYDD